VLEQDRTKIDQHKMTNLTEVFYKNLFELEANNTLPIRKILDRLAVADIDLI
jgi:hypothetical protein